MLQLCINFAVFRYILAFLQGCIAAIQIMLYMRKLQFDRNSTT
jgi:hypothetical protein